MKNSEKENTPDQNWRASFKFNEQSDKLRLLAIFAHPDDETFCAGGTLAKYVANGAETMVVSFTQGDAGQIRDANVATRRSLGKTRAQELNRACAQLGVQHVLCLNYGDGKLQSLNQTLLVEKATEIIRFFKPDIVITFGDDGAYGHPDHIAVGAATDEAFRVSGNANYFPEQVASGLKPHAPARLYHSHFPRHPRLLLQQLVRWLKSLDAHFRATQEFMNGLMLFADESKVLGYASDHINIGWYPAGFYIIEQGEPPSSLYLLLSGHADIYKEDEDGEVTFLAKLEPGVFFGEVGLANNEPRNAHVVARDNVSCLVLSPGEPTGFAGRGEDAQFATDENTVGTDHMTATSCIDVSDYVRQKMGAIAAHRSQYPITIDMFPEQILQEMLGHEYYVRVYPPLKMETDLHS